MNPTLTPQRLNEVLLVEYRVFADDRGFFAETFRQNVFAEKGLPDFVQENHSRSRRGVLRGLHYQKEPKPIAKLVRCVHGRVFDVAVDIRKGSPTFGQWVGVELTGDRPTMLYIPVGFAHGFCALSEQADLVYKVSDYFAPECDRAIRWNDPAIGIQWPLHDPPLVSPKDAKAPLLADSDNDLVYRPRSTP